MGGMPQRYRRSMPELPEVETIRRQLEPMVAGRAIVDAASHPSAKFTPAIEAVGAVIEGVRRRGKFLLFSLDDDRELVIHLGMTGQLVPDAALDDAYLRAWWRLEGPSEPSCGRILGFRDVRRFGRIRIANDGRYAGSLASLGPEPFDDDFTPMSLWTAVKRSNRRLKTQLLSQKPVAGVGNIYADEACFLAGVHPAARSISKAQAEALHDAIVTVLRQGVDNGGTTLRDYVDADGDAGSNQFHLRCYGRHGEPCVRCGTELRRLTLDARTTTYCPVCQRR